LIRIHDESMWLDVKHLIAKEAIRDIASLCSSRPIPRWKSINEQEIIEMNSLTFEGKEIVLRTIEDPVIRYATMVIGHKFFLLSNDFTISIVVVYTTIDMIRRGMDYDLCEII
jgi:hypothetical protein